MDDLFRQWQLADEHASLAQRKMMHGWLTYALGSAPAPSLEVIREYKALRQRADALLENLWAKEQKVTASGRG